MSYPLTQLGSGAFNHSPSSDTEQEYDRLRDLARQEAAKRSSCLDRSHEAHSHGDTSTATHLSSEAQSHTNAMNTYNTQASSYIFRANNAHTPSDTIDLHGQFVSEAESILETRIRAAKAQGADHLHVIVGKGNHSPGHIQKLKPKVEEICRGEGLGFRTEENQGRIFVDLRGGGMQMPQQQQQGGYPGGGGGYHQQQQQQQHGGHGGGGQHHQQQQYHQQQQQQQQDPNAELEAEIKKALPGILRKLRRACCTVM